MQVIHWPTSRTGNTPSNYTAASGEIVDHLVGIDAKLGVHTAAIAPVQAARDPGATDDAGDGYAVGHRWLNTSSKTLWTLVDATIGAAVWVALGALLVARRPLLGLITSRAIVEPIGETLTAIKAVLA